MLTLDNAHALVIGIADYQHIRKLPQVKDVQDIAAVLLDSHYCGYPVDNVLSLVDSQATQAAIREAFATLARRSNAESTVLIYFSGHGGRITSGPHADEYLLPVDTVYPGDERLAQTAISGAELTAALRAIPARKVVVIFDCCHAGGIGAPRDIVVPTLSEGLSEGYYDALASGTGRVILASSRESEYSYVLGGAEYGLFTRHVLAGLRGGIASEDGLIRIFELFEYVQPRVTADHPRQHPIFKGELESNFPVGRYLGGQHGVVPRDEQGYLYDGYISYVDREPDATWVWDTLVPHLKQAGLRIAVSGDVGDPGVARVVNIERGVQQAKRTIIVLSDAYVMDHMATFEHTLVQSMGIDAGAYSLLPLQIAPLTEKLPGRIKMLKALNVVDARRSEREFERLVRTLRGPLPRM